MNESAPVYTHRDVQFLAHVAAINARAVEAKRSMGFAGVMVGQANLFSAGSKDEKQDLALADRHIRTLVSTLGDLESIMRRLSESAIARPHQVAEIEGLLTPVQWRDVNKTQFIDP